MRQFSIFLLLALLTGLSACSFLGVGYRFADNYLYYQIDSLHDLNDTQEDFAKREIDKLLAWHKAQEIPRYIAFLDHTEKILNANQLSENVEAIYSEIMSLRDKTYKKAMSPYAVLLTTQTEEQLVHFTEKGLKKDKDILKEYAEEQGLETRLEESEANIKDWIGDLTDSQRDVLRQLLMQKGWTSDIRLQNRLALRAALLRAIRSKKSAAQIGEILIQGLIEYKLPGQEEVLQRTLEFRKAWQGFLRHLATNLTPKQAATLRHKLTTYRKQLKEL